MNMLMLSLALAIALAFAVAPGGAWELFGGGGPTGRHRAPPTGRARNPETQVRVSRDASAISAFDELQRLAGEPRTWGQWWNGESQCFADAFERLKNASAGPGAFVSCAYEADDELLFDLMNCELRRRELGELQCWSHSDCNARDFDSPVTQRQSDRAGAYALARISQVDLCTYVELQRQNALAASAQAAAHASAQATDAAIHVLSDEQARSCNRTADALGSCNRELVRRADLNGVTLSDLHAALAEIKGLRERLDATWYRAAGDAWRSVRTQAKDLREQLGNSSFAASAAEAVTAAGNALLYIPKQVEGFACAAKNTALGVCGTLALWIIWYLRPRAPRR